MTQPRAPLHLLSAGAAKGLIGAVAPAFEADTGTRIVATFDAAGAIRDAFTAGAACDVLILPLDMLQSLAAKRRVDGASIVSLGSVPTGVAVASGDPLPSVGTEHDLRAALAGASALYCPDLARSTAGLHFDGVLRALGIRDAVESRLRAFANGARAMAALAADAGHGALGCTQVTEILYTAGVALVAPLPPPFELATDYSIAVACDATLASLARAFVSRASGADSEALRRAGGFLAFNASR
jgi:molybdate transport system substrate-binding protein